MPGIPFRAPTPVTAADPRVAVRKLVRAANDAGGRENITALVVDLG